MIPDRRHDGGLARSRQRPKRRRAYLWFGSYGLRLDTGRAASTNQADRTDVSSLRAPCACAAACGSGAPLLPFLARAVPTASRSCAATSSPETHPRAAFSSSRLGEPGRHCYRERGLARAVLSIRGGGRNGPSIYLASRSSAVKRPAALPV